MFRDTRAVVGIALVLMWAIAYWGGNCIDLLLVAVLTAILLRWLKN